MTEPNEQRPYWFVGASYGGTNDQTARFLQEGTWDNGRQRFSMKQVNSMQSGDQIAIKSHIHKKT